MLTSELRTEPTARRTATRGDIQGLRAVAVGAVVLYHAGLPFLSGGYVGVDVFFVISGYLITGQLLREQARTGRISLASFYERRLRRLAPMALLVIVATLVASRIWLPPLLLPAISRDGVASTLALSNVWFAFTGTDYLAHEAPSPFQHYWSLAVEEQFYLVWPLVLIAGALAFRRRRTLGLAIGVTIGASIAAGVWLTSVVQPWAFFSLPTRAWELGVGAILAVGVIHGARIKPWASGILGWGGLTLIAIAVLTFDSTTVFPGWAATIPVVGTAAVIMAGSTKQTRSLAFVLESRPFRFIGDISYSLYLWHWPLLIVPALAIGSDLSPVAVSLLMGFAVFISWLSYLHVEQRFQGSTHPDSRIRNFALGASFTALVVSLSLLVGVLPNLSSDTRLAVPSKQDLMGPPWTPESVPSNLEPSLNAVDASVPLIYEDGCHADVSATVSTKCTYGDASNAGPIVLFGDSHAAQWFTPLLALAKERGLSVVSLTKSACPSVDLPILNASLGREYSECETWRDNALDRINSLEPSIVVIANSSAGYRSLGVTPANFDKQWRDGLRTTLEGLPPSARTVVLSDTPRWLRSPNICLSENLENVPGCAHPREELVDDELSEVERNVAFSSGARFIETDSWLCDVQCSPVLWNKLVYRDSNHITDSMALALTGRLSEGIG